MKVYYIKKARKDNPAVKAGEPYWYTTPRFGGKRYFDHYPRRSELCQGRNAGFYAALEQLEDTCQEAESLDELESAREDCTADLECVRDEYQEGLDNMPEQLQWGPTGETMQEAIDEIENLINELECWQADDELEEVDYHDEEEEYDEEAFVNARDEWLNDARESLAECAQNHCFPY